MLRFIKSAFCVFFVLGLYPVPVGAEVVGLSLKCQTVARVLKSQDPAIQGNLCQGRTLNIKSPVLIACRYKADVRHLKQAGSYKIENLCPSYERSQRDCFSPTCYRSASTLHLIGETFVSKSTSPQLEWNSIDDAESYLIVVSSSSGQILEQQTVSDTKYQIQTPLTAGEFYQVEITALETNQSEKFAFHILSPERLNQLQSVLASIDQSSLSDLERLLYTDAAYASVGLYLDSIRVIEASPLLQKSYELQARLGDRYLDAGYFDQAKTWFEKIARVAPEGSPEHSNAVEFLKLHSQLPTSTKLPQ